MMNPGKSKDNLESPNQEIKSNLDDSDDKEKPVPKGQKATHASKKSIIQQKHELFSRCIEALKEPEEKQKKTSHYKFYLR